MSARAIWKGTLKIGSIGLPVKLYAAVEDRKVGFHLLAGHKKSRVKQRMVGDTGAPVEGERIQKGYEAEPGTFVVIEDEELDKLQVDESREITTLRVVPPSALSNEWYERPYYLGPDGEESRYFALATALDKRQSIGIVRWSMRNRTFVGALMAENGYPLLVRLRYAEEVLPAFGLSISAAPTITEKETRMAKELVSALEGPFDPEAFRDEYRERLRKFIDAKARGKHPKLAAVKERRPEGSLDAQLTRSLDTLKKGREKRVA